MKLVWIVAFVFCCPKLVALPVDNPADPALFQQSLFCRHCLFLPEWIGIRTGYYGDFVYKQHIRRDGSYNNGQVDHASFVTNAAQVVVNLSGRVDIFTTLGMTSAFFESQSPIAIPPLASIPRLELEFNSSFSWSIGGRALLWRWGSTFLGIQGQYLKSHLSLTRFTAADLLSEYPNITTFYHNWTVSSAIAHRFSFLVPYLGVYYVSSFNDFHGSTIFNGVLLPNSTTKLHWGYALGATLFDSPLGGLSVEGRWAAEKALHVNAQISF